MSPRSSVRLDDVLQTAKLLEGRAAALYRGFAAAEQPNDPQMAALWAALALDEDADARSIDAARAVLTRAQGILVCDKSVVAPLDVVARRLEQAESLELEATTDQRFLAAMEVELSALESLRQLKLRAGDHVLETMPAAAHLRRLADMAMKRSHDAKVRLAAALLLTRHSLAHRHAVA